VDLLSIAVGVLAIVAAAVVLFRMMPRRRTEQASRPPHAEPHRETLMADRDDEQHRVEQRQRVER
jgi:hypothetical protein